MANLLNALAGLLLVAQLPLTANTVRVDAVGRFRDLHCDGFTRRWIVAFALWNWVFLLLNFPVIAGHHVAVLGVALAIGLIDPRRWLQTRLFVLAVDLIVLATFADVLVPRLDTTHWSEPRLELFAATASVAMAFWCALHCLAAPARVTA